jgi:hypothetical protein
MWRYGDTTRGAPVLLWNRLATRAKVYRVVFEMKVDMAIIIIDSNNSDDANLF